MWIQPLKISCENLRVDLDCYCEINLVENCKIGVSKDQWMFSDHIIPLCNRYYNDPLICSQWKVQGAYQVSYILNEEDIQVFKISEVHRSGEFGYWLAKDATGKGYMKETVLILEKYCFEELNMHRIQITCDALNEASTKVTKSCGYTYEGTLREDMVDEYRDTMRNTLMFSKLKWEYENQILDL